MSPDLYLLSGLRKSPEGWATCLLEINVFDQLLPFHLFIV